jgi:hypothetical protein
MSLGMGKRPKSKLPNPSTNFKFSTKQDYMSEAMNAPSKKEKLRGELRTGSNMSGESV